MDLDMKLYPGLLACANSYWTVIKWGFCVGGSYMSHILQFWLWDFLSIFQSLTRKPPCSIYLALKL